jgi:hypothetical protein
MFDTTNDHIEKSNSQWTKSKYYRYKVCEGELFAYWGIIIHLAVSHINFVNNINSENQ